MIDAVVAIGLIGFALFCLAWVTIFPTIGLLYWFGYLS